MKSNDNNTQQPVVRFTDVTVHIGDVSALDNITLDIPPNDFLGIIGPNGAGKSTLLRTIIGLEKISSGNVEVLGGSAKQNRKHVGYVPQALDFDKDFPISVRETVLMSHLGSKFFGRYTKTDHELAQQALEKLEIAHLAERPFGQLSGGERQRVLIARALSAKPKILLLDEPTANIDIQAEFGLFELLEDLNREITIIMVTHDLGVVSSYVKTLACLNRQLMCHGFETVTQEMIQKVYGHEVDLVSHGVHRRFVVGSEKEK
jgi:zinc transport system ATP-binding protein